MKPTEAHGRLTAQGSLAPAYNTSEGWFTRFPNGGTVFQRPQTDPVDTVDWFRRAPNGGGTLFLRPEESHDDAE